MATVKYTTLYGSDFGLGNLLGTVNDLQTIERDGKHMVVQSLGTENRVVIEGEGLRYRKDVLVAGTITSVEFTDADGKAFVTFSDMHYDAAKLGPTLDLEEYVDFFETLFIRDDEIFGTGISDYLIGGGRDDVLLGRGGDDFLFAKGGTDTVTGGKGSDRFMFNVNSELDIVTDFDASGGGDQQDYIATERKDYRIMQKGDDTIVNFGDGNRIKLLGVDAAQVDGADFVGLYEV